MPYAPTRTFIENIQAFYDEIDEPLAYAHAKRLAWRLLDISCFLATLKLPRPKEEVKRYYADPVRPHPIPRHPEVAHPGREAEPPGDIAELEPGDHPRPARELTEPQAPLPF